MIAHRAGLCAALPQLLSLECWGGATFDVAMRFLARTRGSGSPRSASGAPNILLQMLLRGSNGVGYTNYPDNVVQVLRRAGGRRRRRSLPRLRLPQLGREHARLDGRGARGRQALRRRDLLHRRHPRSGPRQVRPEILRRPGAASWRRPARTSSASRTWRGLLKPAAAKKLVTTLSEETDLPIHFHTHDTSGIVGGHGAGRGRGRRRCGRRGDGFACRASPRSPASARWSRRSPIPTATPGSTPVAIRQISFYWEAVRAQYAAFECDLRSGASEVYLHEMPGGQFTNLKEQARSLGLEARWHEVARDLCRRQPAVRRHRQGDAVVQGGRRHGADDGRRRPDAGRRRRSRSATSPSPNSVVQMMRGDLGQPPGGWPKALQKKVLKGADADHRAARLAAAAGRSRGRAQGGGREGRHGDRRPRARLLPHVPQGLRRLRQGAPTPTARSACCRRRSSSTACRPARKSRSRSSRARRWSCAPQAIGETDEEGNVRVFFELNGQPRMAKVPDRAHGAGGKAARRKAEEGNAAPCRRADAGRRVDARRPGRPGGQGRRRAALHRGDEDGDRASTPSATAPSPRCLSPPARRSTPRICWWCSAARRRLLNNCSRL